jgi:hypothetical protein
MVYPLDVLYAQAGLAPPRARRLRADQLPPPYDNLLAHQRDMTSTLEAHFSSRLDVRVLTTFMRGRMYYRRVLLALEDSGRPAAMGAVAVTLNAFSPRVRARIVAQRAPLGRLVRESGVDFAITPQAFFEVTPNSEMLGVFHMRTAVPLYGRQTRMHFAGKAIGHIVEVLPRF